MKHAQIRIIGVVIVSLVVAGILLYALRERAQDPAIDTINALQRQAQLSACDQRLPPTISFASSDGINGDLFARTVAICGNCIKHTGGMNTYYLLDEDLDGIPNECDASPSAKPAQLGQTHAEQCLGTLAHTGGIARCCVGDDMIERYCLP